MKLHFRKVGEGKPVVVLHGVFGSSDNLFTVSKSIAAYGYAVYIVDARNHGQSPRSDEFNYEVMAADLDQFLTENNLQHPVLLGHSMGGKTVMQYATNYHNFSQLIVVDIAPKFYPTHHAHILEGLNAIKLSTLKNRQDAAEIFQQYVADIGEQQFLLKNLYRTDDGGFDWRINVPVLTKEIYHVGEELTTSTMVAQPALFLRGGDSTYIADEDIPKINQIFPNATIKTVHGANHWIHAVKPNEFVQLVVEFIN